MDQSGKTLYFVVHILYFVSISCHDYSQLPVMMNASIKCDSDVVKQCSRLTVVIWGGGEIGSPRMDWTDQQTV